MAKVMYFVLAFAIRLVLVLTGFRDIFQQRGEIATPLNSWLRIKEGLFLKNHGIDPYEGDTYHGTLAELKLAPFLVSIHPLLRAAVFILTDLIAGYLLAVAVKGLIDASKICGEPVSGSDAKNAKTSDDVCNNVLAAYLLNPFTILSCVGETSTVFNNLVLAGAILSMEKGCRSLLGVFLAAGTYQWLYPMTLLLPGAICVYRKEKTHGADKNAPSLVVSFIKTFIAFLIPLVVFLYLSYNAKLFDRPYGFILTARDLKPNVGLFWYFFTEMFDHFNLLFLCAFQINSFIYVIPLTIRFFNEPALLVYALCSLGAIFRSYPTIGDVGFYLSMIPMWYHLFPFMQQKFLVSCFLAITTALAPVQWYLWIYSGSANANFYFGCTTGFAAAQIFLVTDVLLAYLKKEYHLNHGAVKLAEGVNAGLSLR